MEITRQYIAKSQKTLNNTLLAIPIFNEFKYVGNLIRAVLEYSDNILAVDDGSTDGTPEVLKGYSSIKVISHRANIGYGQSLIEAFNFARLHNFEWLISLDCDYQHEPSYIPSFYSEIAKADVDIISGSRYLHGKDSGFMRPPHERVVINNNITRILNQHLGFQLTDSFCGFKAYRIQAVCSLKLSEKGYGLPLQLWIQASRANLRIREIPVPLIYHDPERNFGGILEDPQKRINYYVQIIERELGYGVGQDVTQSFRS